MMSLGQSERQCLYRVGPWWAGPSCLAYFFFLNLLSLFWFLILLGSGFWPVNAGCGWSNFSLVRAYVLWLLTSRILDDAVALEYGAMASSCGRGENAPRERDRLEANLKARNQEALRSVPGWLALSILKESEAHWLLWDHPCTSVLGKGRWHTTRAAQEISNLIY